LEIPHVIEALKKPLPGHVAHAELAPYRKSNAHYLKDIKPKLASTLVLLFPDKHNILHFVLIKRPQYSGVHSNQYALPGGKREGNENKKETALRETQEEIGIKRDEIQIIGKLSEIYVPPSNFLIFPFIGYCSFTPLFTADQNEVDEIIKIQLDELFKNDVVKSTHKSIIHNGQRFNMSVPFLDLNGRDVWGATGAILNELKVILSS